MNTWVWDADMRDYGICKLMLRKNQCHKGQSYDQQPQEA